MICAVRFARNCGVRRSRYNFLIVDVRFSVFCFSSFRSSSVFLVSKNGVALFTLGGGGGRAGGGGGVAVLVFLASLLVVHSEKTLPVDATVRRAACRH